ncbi:MAG TPA: hypothetical protein VNV66_03650, partial [Pilimelia sp.]|nr:hypothetical protein [Pilimelia sp.]
GDTGPGDDGVGGLAIGTAVPSGLATGLGSAVAKAVEAAEVAVELTGRVAKNSGGFPVASLLAMFAFLVAQNRFDRRDPKLAVAPVVGDPYLRFGAPPEEPEADPADNPPAHDPEHDEEGGDDHPYPSR